MERRLNAPIPFPSLSTKLITVSNSLVSPKSKEPPKPRPGLIPKSKKASYAFGMKNQSSLNLEVVSR
jgi:hypothetical protein